LQPWIWGAVAAVGWLVALVIWLLVRRAARERQRQQRELAATLRSKVEPWLLRMCAERKIVAEAAPRGAQGDPTLLVAHLGHLGEVLARASREHMAHDDTENMATSDTVPLSVEHLAEGERNKHKPS
jgi:flagellar biosynthesis/type III secretory pathway M-ring protein FliF/YscJ